jgi:radical SAM superfamily enzyme YgiQ (UPF0313 family)
LDDNLFADTDFAEALFAGMKGMGKVWQCAGTVQAVLNEKLLKMAVDCGLSSMFIGFETLQKANLSEHSKKQNLSVNYVDTAKILHDNNVMINGSFVFGMDNDTIDTSKYTVDWAVKQGIETATFHILTPYPGTKLYQRMNSEGRILHNNWDLYDTRHAVFQPRNMLPSQLENCYWQSYKDFYSWSSIWKSAYSKESVKQQIKHFAYTTTWKKADFMWDYIIKHNHLKTCSGLLERLLAFKICA